MRRCCANARALAAELQQWLDRPRAERLKDGVLVVIAGPPNAGKSSLLNAIAGEERAIVTDVPGTTRDHIEVPLALGGIPVRLTDTAGLREAADRVEAIGVERAEQLVEAADVLMWLGDPDEAPAASPADSWFMRRRTCPARRSASSRRLSVSAKTGAGLGALLDRIRGSGAEPCFPRKRRSL